MRQAVTTGKRSPSWALLGKLEIGTADDPYLTRRRIVQTPLFGVMLHRIHHEDRDPDPHDHPWPFISIRLAGGYVEQVWPDKHDLTCSIRRSHHRGSVSLMRRSSAHKITSVISPLRTLVLTGPRSAEGWGFWTTGGYKPWYVYVK